MESDLKIRKVTQDVLKFSCFKHQIIKEKPPQELRFTPEITPQFMNNICKVIWFQSLVKDSMWSGFFEKNFQRMTSSTEMFTKYVSFACYAMINSAADGYDMFFTTLPMVTYFGFRCWEKGLKKFLNVCVHLFCALYEKEIRSEFESQGGLKNFNEFLKNEINKRNLMDKIDLHIPSSGQFTKRYNLGLKKDRLMLIIRRIETFTQTMVENDGKVISFSKSIAPKIEELYQKAFDEILADFAKTDSQVEEMYRQTFGNTTGELSSESNPISSEKVKGTLKMARHNKSEILEVVRQMVTSHKLDTHNSDVSIEASSHLSPKSEKIRKLLDDISVDYVKLYEIIQSLSEKHGVQFPEPMEAETKLKELLKFCTSVII